MSNLKVFSGKCCLCDVGVDISQKDYMGESLHTGDIVQIWNGNYIGTDSEIWYPSGSLTVVVSDQYQSFSDGRVTQNDDAPEPFVMGIKSCGFDDPEWQILIVKKFRDVVDGEHWPAYGFSYKAKEIQKT